mmetsp:Transcript_8159/g.9405  ORF Transcript_8159/g.9405 Transcript_8159/m.9405 type:complete len:248 (-) Transcript_8159:29-772(-)
MKLSLIAIPIILGNFQVNAFTITPITTATRTLTSTSSTSRRVPLKMFFAEDVKNDVKAENTDSENNDDDDDSMSMSMAGSIYDRLGFKEDQIGMNIDPEEVLQWIGDRDAMITRFMNDNDGLKKDEAEKEVDRFMMDAEMVKALITYEQKTAKGEVYGGDDGPDLFTLAIGGYAIYIFGSAAKRYLDGKAAADAIVDGVLGGGDSVVVSVGDVIDVAQSSGLTDFGQIDAVQNTIQAIQTTMDAISM